MITLTPATHEEFQRDPFAQYYRSVLFFGLLLLCCFTRLYSLEWKTMMHDETLFAEYSWRHLYKDFNYYYQPILHGPLMLHIQNVVFHVFGPSDYTVRLGCALLGVGGFFFLWALRYWLGEAGTWFVLLFYGLSPGITFFHRFFHMDSLYMFNTLWIVASLANWWRTRDGSWAASAVIALMMLFCTKASSVFLYFSLGTFLALYLIHDLTKWLFEGKSVRLTEHLEPAPRFPNAFWPALVLSVFVMLVLTQVFEGIKYDADVRKAIGHDWVLKDVRSIPVALGWKTLDATSAPDAGPAASATIWRLAYVGLLAGSLVLFGLLKVASDKRLGYTEGTTRIWRMVYDSRWHLLGASTISVALYILIYTTFMKHQIGPFEIFSRTWSYWGGQHEWGRIPGPFHQHMMNLVVYELPSLLVVLGVWFGALFRLRPARDIGVAMILMLVPVAAFHKLIFSGIDGMLPGGAEAMPIGVMFLKNIFVVGAVLGAGVLLFPRAARAVVPGALVALVVYSIHYFNTAAWDVVQRSVLYKDGAKIEIMGRHMTMHDYMEVQFNMDGGWNLALVLVLVFFATYHAWTALSAGRRFEAFTVWWLVTMVGAASYAREGVPQVGIHCMLPTIVLAGIYMQRIFQRFPAIRMARMTFVLLGIAMLWNAKASFNLNFRNADDPRERMAYGPNAPDVRNHLLQIRAYNDIAGIRMAPNGVAQYITDYNNKRQFKNTRIYMRPVDGITWPARWYLRDVEWIEGQDPTNAINERWDFIVVRPDDLDKYPGLKEHYHTAHGRGTTFWTPSPISQWSLLNVWKSWIPGHYSAGTPHENDARVAFEDWRRIRRYALLRETFDGTNRPFPSVSMVGDYVLCWRKDLY